MTYPSLEKIELSDKLDLFEFSWPVDKNLSLADAYSLAYQFGQKIDTFAQKVPLLPSKALYGVRVFNNEGHPYCAEDSGDLQLYNNWPLLEKDVQKIMRSIGESNRTLCGFHIGFRTVDVTYLLKDYVEASNTSEKYSHFALFQVASFVNIKTELEQFVKQINPSADVDKLNDLVNYKLENP